MSLAGKVVDTRQLILCALEKIGGDVSKEAIKSNLEKLPEEVRGKALNVLENFK